MISALLARRRLLIVSGIGLLLVCVLAWRLTRSEDTASSAAPAGGAAQTATPPTEATPAAPTQGAAGEWKVTRTRLSGAPERDFRREVGDDGEALSQAWARLFVWDVNLRTELAKGDEALAVWRKSDTGDYEIAMASLRSAKKGRTFVAHRFVAPGDKYASWWTPEGVEVPYRLKDGPLHDYDQITSLLKDRPKHKGMDFKTPTGTEVHSPRAGTVARVNWNWKSNGNCVEVRYDDGTLAKFLHLSKILVKEGEHVTAGQVIAQTGNTGHTTAPHLHYQLNAGDKIVVDPVQYHGTERRSLDTEGLAGLKRAIAQHEALIGIQTAGL